MIEKTIMDFLHERESVQVLAEIPSPPPGEYILVVKTGGTSRDFLNTSQIVIATMGKTLHRAAELSEAVKRDMPDLVSLDVVTKVKRLEEGNVTDSLAKRHRYQLIYEITHY